VVIVFARKFQEAGRCPQADRDGRGFLGFRRWTRST